MTSSEIAQALLLIVFISGLVALFFSLVSRAQLRTRRLARIERKLDRILSHLDIGEEDGAQDPVRALVLEGRKIDAIKAYREQTGAGLRDARDAVKEMERRLLVR